ncbi:MAG: lysylphosphatidylglycerol synthase domain-containing protein [Polyangiaceae bacterium]
MTDDGVPDGALSPRPGTRRAATPGSALWRRRTLVHVAAAVLGVLALVLLVRGVGVVKFFAVVATSAPWLPALFALEAVRLGTEIAMTCTVTRAVRERVPLSDLLRIHVVAFGVSLVLPAGRATAEATRAAMLSPFVGAVDASAIAFCNQSMVLLGGALIAIPCLASALWMTGLSPLVATIFGFTCATSIAFALCQLGARRAEVGGLVRRYAARMGPAATAFQNATRSLPLFPLGPVVSTFASRVVQVIEYAVLLFALGRRNGVAEPVLAEGVNLVGGAVGDFIPGQVGATDGAFALAARSIGITAADGVAIAVMLHFVQVVWALVGLSAPLWWRRGVRTP